MAFCDIHQRPVSQEELKIWSRNMGFKNTQINNFPHHRGANELRPQQTRKPMPDEKV